MIRGHGTNTDEAAIRAVIDGIARAVRAKDVEAMLAHCAPDVVTFDMLPPLVHEGYEGIRRIWAQALVPFETPIEYETERLAITVGGDVAFCRSVNRFAGKTKDGERTVNRLRTTLGLRKVDGRWSVAHQHVSVPFDVESGQALLELGL